MRPQIVAVFRPNGATGCSRGWSGGAARRPDAEPVERSGVLILFFSPRMGRRRFSERRKQARARRSLRPFEAKKAVQSFKACPPILRAGFRFQVNGQTAVQGQRPFPVPPVHPAACRGLVSVFRFPVPRSRRRFVYVVRFPFPQSSPRHAAGLFRSSGPRFPPLPPAAHRW